MLLCVCWPFCFFCVWDGQEHSTVHELMIDEHMYGEPYTHAEARGHQADL